MSPNIWVYDIETSPNLVYSWGIWDQNIGLNQIVETQDILCFAATKIGAKGIESHTAWDGYDGMIRRLHEIMDDADLLVGYNHINYDNKHVRAAFVKAGLTPPSPHRDIDLMREVKRNFKFQSYKLAHVCQELGLSMKSDPGGFDTWKQILAGEGEAQAAAQRRMVKYCRNDTKITAELFHRLRPWIAGLNIPLYDSGGTDTGTSLVGARCTKCDGTTIHSRGWAYTTTNRYRRYQCKKCGGWMRAAKSEPVVSAVLRNG